MTQASVDGVATFEKIPIGSYTVSLAKDGWQQIGTAASITIAPEDRRRTLSLRMDWLR